VPGTGKDINARRSATPKPSPIEVAAVPPIAPAKASGGKPRGDKFRALKAKEAAKKAARQSQPAPVKAAAEETQVENGGVATQEKEQEVVKVRLGVRVSLFDVVVSGTDNV
jgi:hypothetical protein